MKITKEYILQDLLAREYFIMQNKYSCYPIDCIIDDSIDVEAIEEQADRLYELYLETGVYNG